MKIRLLKFLPLLALMINSSITSAQLWTPVFTALDSTAGNKVITTSTLNDFSFFDENRGITTFNNKYHVTTNGGALWSDSGYVQHTPIWGVSYVDSQTIFAHSGSRIIKSVNAGSSFSVVTFPIPTFSGALIKVEGRFGLAAGRDCGAAYSNDGGDTWTSIAQATLCNSSGGGPTLSQLDIIDSSTAFIAGKNGNIFKTSDGGASWSRITPPIFGSVPGTDILGLDFIDDERGFIIQASNGSGGNVVYKTVDGGTTWTTITPPFFGTNIGGNYKAIFAEDSNTIYLGAYYQNPVGCMIYKSTNGGVSYSIDKNFTVGASTSNIQFNKFQRVKNTLFVSTANGDNSSSAPPKDPGLTRIYKRNLSANANGIEDSKTQLRFSLAPNPASHFTIIEGIDFKTISAVSIFSIDGKLIRTIQQPQLSIDIADLNAGLYFMKIETKNGQSGIARFIKQ